MYIYTQADYSEGASLLKQAMGLVKIKKEKSAFKGNLNKVVINWGSSQLSDEIMKCHVVNMPESVGIAANKLRFFQAVDDDLTVPWTNKFEDAVKWLAEGTVVFARTKLSGHSGEGIVIMTPDKPDGFVKAPLFTKYIKKAAEYRIHVVEDEVIDVQWKTLRAEKREAFTEKGEPINWFIRNLDNGFIYQRSNIDLPKSVSEVAVKALNDTGLHFGAVDVIYNEKLKRAFVLEINTAPGLAGTTVGNYARALERYR